MIVLFSSFARIVKRKKIPEISCRKARDRLHCGRRCHTPIPMPWGPCACEVAPRCKFGKEQKLFRTPDDWLLRLISGRAGVCTNCKRLNRTVREAYPVSGGNSFAQFCERRDPPVYPRLPRVPSAVLVGVVVRVRFARRLYAPHLLLPRSVPSGSLLPHHSHTPPSHPTPRPPSPRGSMCTLEAQSQASAAASPCRTTTPRRSNGRRHSRKWRAARRSIGRLRSRAYFLSSSRSSGAL